VNFRRRSRFPFACLDGANDERSMPALSFSPALSLLAAFHRVSPIRPLRTFIRSADEKLNPPRQHPHVPLVRRAQDRVVAGGAGLHQLTTVLREKGRGRTPTIVLGGFIPESTEQVFLLRRFFLRSGDLYYLNYPRSGFSVDLLCAQLDDLVEELSRRAQPPIIFTVSFGSGLLLEWLKRAREASRETAISGVVMISPVACVADLIAPNASKPSTLLGRALKPYLDPHTAVREETVQKSRVIFARMFEAGAQNRTSLRSLMTPAELNRLHAGVMSAIRAIDGCGARERVRSICTMAPLSSEVWSKLSPLTAAPALILYAESEETVLDAASPTRRELERAHGVFLPNSRLQIVRNPFGPPVQHASLIFHVFDFLPPISAFYQRSKVSKLKTAA